MKPDWLKYWLLCAAGGSIAGALVVIYRMWSDA